MLTMGKRERGGGIEVDTVLMEDSAKLLISCLTFLNIFLTWL